jgi:type II secretory pathway pseudopilin PulG
MCFSTYEKKVKNQVMFLKRKKLGKKAFTIIEVIVASGILSFIFIGTIFSIQYSQIQNRKTTEYLYMLDFCRHYLEISRGKPFAEILPGQTINTMFDGEHGAPDVRFPADSNWRTMLTEDLRNFHPDLEWFVQRAPEYRLFINNQLLNGNIVSRHLRLEVRWKPPLEKGTSRSSIRLDSVIYSQFDS